MADNGRCRCGSGGDYDRCCGPLHRGETPAATAVALMRSRFTAFAIGDADYLLATWHRSSRPKRLELDSDIVWRRLQIVDAIAGNEHDTDGVVEFRAQYERGGRRHIMTERSRFLRSKNIWLYVDGDLPA